MSKNTDMAARHRRYEEMVSHKGIKHDDMFNPEKSFIDCQYCNERIYGKNRDIDQYYKNHLQNYHQEKQINNDEKRILGKNY